MRICRFEPEAFGSLEAWLAGRRLQSERRLERPEDYPAQQDQPKKR
jgi:hypothetical protein